MKIRTSPKRILSMLLTLAMALTLLPTVALAAPGDVAINPTNFPDSVFRTHVATIYDTDNDGVLSATEIAATTSIFVNHKEITSLKGVEYFTALTHLYSGGNQLTSLDVSKNTLLIHLECDNNQLTSLDVSKNTALIDLYCGNNQMTSLDVSKNTALEGLACGDNQLTSLDVSKNTALEGLYCGGNQLASLDVSKNTALVDLECYTNQLTSLDVSKNTELKHLQCAQNQLTSLDVSKNTKLKNLRCYKNQLTSLDVSKNTGLEDLQCYNNQLTGLDVSKNTALLVLYCSDNQLTSLDVSKSTPLMLLECNSNFRSITLAAGKTFDLSALPGFDVSKATNFVGGTVSGNILTATNHVITYQYNCGNSKTADFKLYIEAETITGVSVTPTTANVQKGTTQQFNASVTGTNLYDDTVTWTVTGGGAGTSISPTGLLTVDAGETATTLTVKATSNGDHSKVSTAAVAVTSTPVIKYALTVTNGTGAGTYESGKVVNITATAAPAGQQFKNWTTSDGGTFGNASSASTTYTMPANATTVTANYEPIPVTEYTIHFNVNGGSGTVADQTTTSHKLTSLPTATRSGYTFNGWYTAASGGTMITTSTVFAAETTVYAQWTLTGGTGSGGGGGGGGGGAASTFTLTFNTNGGSAIASISKAGGTAVDLASYKPTKTGYNFDGWYSDSGLTAKVTSVTLTANTTVYAKWTAATNTSDLPFTDVPDDSYYKDAVSWAVDEGITEGTGPTIFNPDGICTRAQAATFLWRASGAPAPKTTTMPFNDVPTGSYYYNAVLWAVEQGIIKGTSETTFSPDMNCSRAHIVTMLWRMEGSKTATAANPFADVSGEAYYADAVLWAVEKEVTAGTSATTFSPDDNCTRAQIVTFIYRDKK